MSPRHQSSAPSSPLTASAWAVGQPIEHHVPSTGRSGAKVVGLGEGAHFVTEFNERRAHVCLELVERLGFAHLALEVGSDEAPAIEAWLRGTRVEPLRELVGPLSYALYGTFLTELRRGLTSPDHIGVLGVDLPNSLTITPSLEPLADVLATIDPHSDELVATARRLASSVRGDSAAASAMAWAALDRSSQDELTVAIARLAARVRTLRDVRSDESDRAQWERAEELVDALVATDLMLRAMADLFAGTGLEAETSVRERFIATSLLTAVRRLPADGRVVYVAHNNHVQKAPVVFDGYLAAYPTGQYLARALGEDYAAIGLSHLGPDVPEMAFPAETSVGFRVERSALPTVEPGSIEAAAASASSGSRRVVTPGGFDGAATSTTIRSQSAVSQVPRDAFDAVLVVESASTDPTVHEIGLEG